MSASMPCSASTRRVSSGYSVLTRSRPGRPARLVASSPSDPTGLSAPTASTMRAGLDVDFEYGSSPRETTLLPRSSMQSRPVMPRSKRPSDTYTGISWGRRMRTSLMRGSSMPAR